MNQDYTHVTLVIDRSGSMFGVRRDVIEGLNSFVGEQRQQPGTCTITEVQFDNLYEVPHNFVSINDIPAWDESRFVPRGFTALLDAVNQAIITTGETLEQMAEQDRPGNVLVVIYTDGHENASKEITEPALRALIEQQQEQYNWSFIFLGANIDSFSVANNLGIDVDNVINYVADSDGVTSSMKSVSAVTSSYRATGDASFAAAGVDNQETLSGSDA